MTFIVPRPVIRLHKPLQKCVQKRPRLCVVPDWALEPPRTLNPPRPPALAAVIPLDGVEPVGLEAQERRGKPGKWEKEQRWEGVAAKESLYIVDGAALLHRGYHALSKTRMSSKNLADTRAVYGFLIAFLSLLEKACGSANIVVVFEGGKGWRSDVYKEYKQTRSATPAGIREGRAWVKRIVELLGLAVVQVDGWEADDVIGTLTKVAQRSGVEDIVIVSEDKDFLQLLDHGVRILKQNRKTTEGYRIVSVESFRDENGNLDPEDFVDVLALVGDKVDNIPGVNGIGPKTAQKLIGAFGSVEKVIESIKSEAPTSGSVSEKRNFKVGKAVREKILQNSDLAMLSKRLVTISSGVPLLGLKWLDLRRKPVNRAGLEVLLTTLSIDQSRISGRLQTLVHRGASFVDAAEASDGISLTTPAIEEKPSPRETVRSDNVVSVSSEVTPTSFVPGEIDYRVGPTYTELAKVLRDPSLSSIGICVLDDLPLVSSVKSGEEMLAKSSEASGKYDLNNWRAETFDETAIGGVAVSVSTGKSYFIRFPGSFPRTRRRRGGKTPLQLLFDVLENPDIAKHGRGLKGLLKRLAQQHKVKLKGRLYDVDICNTLFHFGDPPKMSDSVDLQLGSGAVPFFFPESVSTEDCDLQSSPDTSSRLYPFGLTPEECTCARADAWKRMVDKLKAGLVQRGALRLLEDIECPLVSVLGAMEMAGVGIYKKKVCEIEEQVKKELSRVENEVGNILGHKDFNLLSPAQVAEILYGGAEGKSIPRKMLKSGKASTNERSLRAFIKHCRREGGEKAGTGTKEMIRREGQLTSDSLKSEDDQLGFRGSLEDRARVAELVLEFRGLSRIAGHYTRVLVNSIDKRDKRIHAHFSQLGGNTGRLAVANPNLQTVPVRSEIGSRLRDCIRARKGYTLLCADYSQIEMRILASMSNDRNLVTAFNNGEDVHSFVATSIFKTGSPSNVTKAQRSKAKAVSYGIPYGLTAFGLSQNLGISQGEAKTLIRDFHNAFPEVERLTRDLVALARERGFAETVYGRKLSLPLLGGGVRAEQQMAERVAINMPIQGTQADMIKLAMVKIHSRLSAANARSRMILQIHDELILEVAKHEKDEVLELVTEEMTHALPLRNGVPVVVNAGFGRSWLAAAPH